MRLKLKEDPREWRKTVLLTVPGLAIVFTLLHWRRILPLPVWIAALIALAVVALTACLRPRWFRGYYRFSQRLGFLLSQCVGHVILMFFFLLVMTPLGLVLRLLGKDLLKLKRAGKTVSYWIPARETSPLDRLF